MIVSLRIGPLPKNAPNDPEISFGIFFIGDTNYPSEPLLRLVTIVKLFLKGFPSAGVSIPVPASKDVVTRAAPPDTTEKLTKIKQFLAFSMIQINFCKLNQRILNKTCIKTCILKISYLLGS